MKKVFFFIITVLVLCPVILISGFASDNIPVNSPQDILSRHQLSDYVSAVTAVNDSLIEDESVSNKVAATITFADYISFEELQTYVDTYDIQLQQIQLRGLMEDGTRVTMATLVHKGMKATEDLAYAQALNQGFELVGITDVYAYVIPSNIINMNDDALTYLVDTTGNTTATAANNATTATTDSSTDSAFPKSLTWELENLNLM